MESLFNFFLDQRNRISAKAAFLVIGITVIILLNDIFNFSSSYVIGDKISQIKELNAIIKDSVTDKRTKDFAIEAREKIIENSNIIDSAIEYLNNISWKKKIELKNHPEHKYHPVQDKTAQTDDNKQNIILQHLSSGGFFYFFGLFLSLIIFFLKKEDIVTKISDTIITILSFFLFGWIISTLNGLIPIINYEQIWINYIINLLIQSAIVFLMVKTINYSSGFNK